MSNSVTTLMLHRFTGTPSASKAMRAGEGGALRPSMTWYLDGPEMEADADRHFNESIARKKKKKKESIYTE